MSNALDLRIKRLQESNEDRSEIACYPSRLQPYAVWHNGFIYGFFANKEDALGRFEQLQRGMK